MFEKKKMKKGTNVAGNPNVHHLSLDFMLLEVSCS